MPSIQSFPIAASPSVNCPQKGYRPKHSKDVYCRCFQRKNQCAQDKFSPLKAYRLAYNMPYGCSPARGMLSESLRGQKHSCKHTHKSRKGIPQTGRQSINALHRAHARGQTNRGILVSGLGTFSCFGKHTAIPIKTTPHTGQDIFCNLQFLISAKHFRISTSACRKGFAKVCGIQLLYRL